MMQTEGCRHGSTGRGRHKGTSISSIGKARISKPKFDDPLEMPGRLDCHVTSEKMREGTG